MPTPATPDASQPDEQPDPMVAAFDRLASAIEQLATAINAQVETDRAINAPKIARFERGQVPRPPGPPTP